MATGRRTNRRPTHRSARLVAAVAGLLTLASAGLIGWHLLLAPPPVAAGGTAALGGLTAEVREAGWVDFDMGHVMDGQGGFMMPDQMMPGAPSTGQVRLGVTLTLRNTDSRTHGFNLPEEFTLVADGTSDPYPLRADTVGGLPRLGPDTAVDGVLYFDIDMAPDADPLYLQWRRDGQTIRIPVPLTDQPAHPHGYP